jgi:hypothetical protein
VATEQSVSNVAVGGTNKIEGKLMDEELAKAEEALARLEEIFKESGFGGMAIVVSPNHIQYQLHLSPPWSCAEVVGFSEGKPKVEFKYEEGQEARANDTAHLLFAVRDICLQWGLGLDQLYDLLTHASKEPRIRFSRQQNPSHH